MDEIIYWKEVQRAIGSGQFWWGIGNTPRRTKIERVLQEARPTVMFSVQKKKAPLSGQNRMRMLWTRYIDSSGALKTLGRGVYITSESLAGRGQHAIVARSDKSLAIAQGIGFDTGFFKHYNGKENLGQTVTCVLERRTGRGEGILYDQGFYCDFVDIVELRDPIPLSIEQIRELDDLVHSRPSPEVFLQTMSRVRGI